MPFRSVHLASKDQIKKWTVNLFRTYGETLYNFIKAEQIKYKSGRQNVFGFIAALASAFVMPALIKTIIQRISHKKKNPSTPDTSEYLALQSIQEAARIFPLGQYLAWGLQRPLNERMDAFFQDIRRSKKALNRQQYDEALKYGFYSSGYLFGYVGPSQLYDIERYIKSKKK